MKKAETLAFAECALFCMLGNLVLIDRCFQDLDFKYIGVLLKVGCEI